MNVRLASSDEAERLWVIRNQAIRHGCKDSYDEKTLIAWTPDLMPEGHRRAIANNPFFVIDDPLSGSPVATGFLDLTQGSVEAIFTLPEFTGKGLATLILQAIKSEAKRRNLTSLTLSATPNACDFYKKHGFTLIKESLHYSKMAGTNLRCMEMRCQL